MAGWRALQALVVLLFWAIDCQGFGSCPLDSLKGRTIVSSFVCRRPVHIGVGGLRMVQASGREGGESSRAQDDLNSAAAMCGMGGVPDFLQQQKDLVSLAVPSCRQTDCKH